MEHNMFYEQVSRWIDSYRDAGPLEWLRRFVDHSTQPTMIKERLYREIDRKVAALRNLPYFSVHDGVHYLMDKHGHPEIFTTHYSAVNKVMELRRNGYDVRIIKGNVFSRIQLIQPAPIDVYQPLDALTAHSLAS